MTDFTLKWLDAKIANLKEIISDDGDSYSNIKLLANLMTIRHYESDNYKYPPIYVQLDKSPD